MRRVSFKRTRELGADRGGNTAVVFAIVLPAVCMFVAAGVELGFLASDRGRMQDAADASALAAASELAFGSQDSVLARAEARALELVGSRDRAEVTADARVLLEGDKVAGVTVDMESRRHSFFGDMLPPGGFVTRVSASAMGMNSAPLCVFGMSSAVANGVEVVLGKVTATGCVIHSNANVRINTASTVLSAAVQAVGLVSGPAAVKQNGAEPILDPFTSVKTGPTSWTTCVDKDIKLDKEGETRTVNPGVHCGLIELDKTSVLRLGPGVHYFRDNLQMKARSRLEGDNVVVVLGQNLTLDLHRGPDDQPDDGVRWNLKGRQAEGDPLSGFVLAVDRARTNEVLVPAKVVERLEGVVYAPTAKFTIDGKAAAAGESAWTVLVGKELRMTNSANVMINTDYAASDVPVPRGVGNKISREGNRLVD